MHCGYVGRCHHNEDNNDIIVEPMSTSENFEEIAEKVEVHVVRAKVYPDTILTHNSLKSEDTTVVTDRARISSLDDNASQPRPAAGCGSDCGCSACSENGSAQETVSGLKRLARVFRLSHTERKKSFGYRPRVPSEIDLTGHPEGYWWSDGNPCCAKIKKDLYYDGDVHIMSKLVEVKLVDSFDGNRTCDHSAQYNWLAEYSENGTVDRDKRYVIFSIKVGEKTVTTLSEILPDHVNRGDWEGLFATPQACENALKSRLKICVVPANAPFPVPAKGPKDAEFVTDYWAKKDVSIMQQSGDEGHSRVVMLTVNLYSSFIVKTLIKKLAFTEGRISDFFLIDWQTKSIVACCRIIATKQFINLLKS